MPMTTRGLILDDIIESLDVPDSSYEAAERRYKDIGEWLLDRKKAESAALGPHVFAQGSFRLGTVTRPWKREDYDLDLSCKLQEGVTKSEHTQEELKGIIGTDLENYRQERGIRERPEEKHRCWRLIYQDDLSFHMDIVPAIPEVEGERQELLEGLVKIGTSAELAREVAAHAVAVTDNRHPEYKILTPRWHVGNQEGYALWFESRMQLAQQFLESRAAGEKVATVDDLPVYRWRTPLQRCIQILKRHRDMMFENDTDGKPISVIITTLAGHSYQGESDAEEAMQTILDGMGGFVNASPPRVRNPVNANEDFADKWPSDPRLEQNFWKWLESAQEDFSNLSRRDDVEMLTEIALEKYGADIDATKLRSASGLLDKAAAITTGEARTSPSGTIGKSGVKNQPHKFYGQK